MKKFIEKLIEKIEKIKNYVPLLLPILVLIYLIVVIGLSIGLSFLLEKKYSLDKDTCSAIITGSFVLFGIPLSALLASSELEKHREYREQCFNKKTSMELELFKKLDYIKVWKRSSPDSYQTDTQENEAATGANSYNKLLVEYINFCKSIEAEPIKELKYITNIYNNGEDFEYGTEPKLFSVLKE